MEQNMDLFFTYKEAKHTNKQKKQNNKNSFITKWKKKSFFSKLLTHLVLGLRAVSHSFKYKNKTGHISNTKKNKKKEEKESNSFFKFILINKAEHTLTSAL